MNSNPLVSICCITYNHARYIRQCLDGFLMQKVNFEYEIIVHDDASTDGTSEIIRDYSNKYSDLIVPIFQSENQYSKGVRGVYAKFVYPHARGKYIAICEGDDYWIDPLKLQKQVDFLEKNPAFLMSVSKALFFSETNKEFVFMPYNAEEQSVTLKPANVILKGGLYINTCSIVFRSELNNYMKRRYIKNSPIGDYPLQIVAAMEGKIFYFGDSMCVYRVNNNQSWVGRQAQIDIKTRVDQVCNEVEMLLGFAKDYPFFEKYFKRRINFYLNSQYRLLENRDCLDCGFSKYEHFRTFFWKMDRYAIKKNIKLLLRITNFFVRRIMSV